MTATKLTAHLDILIAGKAGRAVSNTTRSRPLGCTARTAHAWVESLHTRAQIRAERHLHSIRQ